MDRYFLKMIQTLRRNEEIIVYSNVLETDEAEHQHVIDFLAEEYRHEALNYPFDAPDFNRSAALWAATTVYVSSQLILHRESKPVDLSFALPNYAEQIDEAAILSADLCLRFLPDMIVQLKFTDSEDALIETLEGILICWHYSGINHSLPIKNLDFTITTDVHHCLHHLYVNRIIEYKKLALALIPPFENTVKALMGIYGKDLWKEFLTETTIHE
jgi:MoxR-vWA-beta-propeller ternary system domain bpX4